MAVTSIHDDSYPMKSMNQGEVSEGSLAPEGGQEVIQSQDEAVLAYYGKRQQLKVGDLCPLPQRLLNLEANPPFAEELRPLVSCRPDLHHPDHLGGSPQVCTCGGRNATIAY